MSISKAQPIQFWAVDEQTYNEQEVCGITPVCWCQPFECDDEIKVYAATEMMDNPEAYSPALVDTEGVIVYDSNGFGSEGWHSVVPSLYGLCNGFYQWIIYIAGTRAEIDNGTFTGTLAPSANGGGSGPSWAYNSDHARVTLPNSGTPTKRLLMPFDSVAGVEYSFQLNFDILQGTGSAGNTTRIVVYLTDDVDFADNDEITTLPIGNGQTHTFTITPTVNRPYIGIIVIANSASSQGRIIDLDSVVKLSPSSDQGVVLYKSDCIDIRETHECTNLITYYNASNFAGINYANQSPPPSFTVRVPSVFFHEQFPREDKVIELSTREFIRTYSKMESKKLFQVAYVPYYFWKKLNMILMHDFITIGDEQWVVQDGDNLVLDDGNKRYPLKKGSVLLTEKDFVKRNLL